MARIFPIHRASLADSALETLACALASLPEPWSALCDRRLAPGDERADAVLVHPELGIALVNSVPNHPAAAGALRRLLERERFDLYFPGELPILALETTGEEPETLAGRLQAAFDAAPRLDVEDSYWADAVVELLLEDRDLAMAPIGSQPSPIAAGTDAPSEPEPPITPVNEPLRPPSSTAIRATVTDRVGFAEPLLLTELDPQSPEASRSTAHWPAPPGVARFSGWEPRARKEGRGRLARVALLAAGIICVALLPVNLPLPRAPERPSTSLEAALPPAVDGTEEASSAKELAPEPHTGLQEPGTAPIPPPAHELQPIVPAPKPVTQPPPPTVLAAKPSAAPPSAPPPPPPEESPVEPLPARTAGSASTTDAPAPVALTAEPTPPPAEPPPAERDSAPPAAAAPPPPPQVTSVEPLSTGTAGSASPTRAPAPVALTAEPTPPPAEPPPAERDSAPPAAAVPPPPPQVTSVEPLSTGTAGSTPPTRAPAPVAVTAEPAAPPPAERDSASAPNVSSRAPESAARAPNKPSAQHAVAEKPRRVARAQNPEEIRPPINQAPPAEGLQPPIDAGDLPPLDPPIRLAAPAGPSTPTPRPSADATARSDQASGPPVPLTRSRISAEEGASAPPSRPAQSAAVEPSSECAPYISDKSMSGGRGPVQGIACRDPDGRWRVVNEGPRH
jgi:hypothetical protein